jgi:beta-propeller repeat-containing protein
MSRAMRPHPAPLAVAASLAFGLATTSMTSGFWASAPAGAVPEATVTHPLVFEANRGQADEHVKFLARGAAYTAFLTTGAAVLQLGRADAGGATVHMTLVDADPAPRIAGDGELPGVVHYARNRPSPPISAPTYRAVRYGDVYPGIDLVYHGSPRRLEYDFVVAPGADPSRIALAFDGVERIGVDETGDLVARTAAGDLRQPRPVVYQDAGGGRRRVDGDYVVDDRGHVRIRVGAYDPSRPLVIDPVILSSTYLGGSNDEADYAFGGQVAVAVDGAGNVYVTGTTTSVDFPTTRGAGQSTLSGEKDVFVTKLSPAGAVLYSTYLGGPCDDAARDIAVDAAGNAYVTGRVNGGQCYLDVQAGVLVAKLDPTGAVVYATVFGGSLADSSIGEAITIDTAGHAYVTGTAFSASHDFPTTPGAFRTTDCGASILFNDGFVAELSADGASLVYSTMLCGTGDDSPSDIAIDTAGNAYVAGTTGSSDFPTVNPFQGSRGNGPVGITGFVSKLSPDGSHLVFSTYLGGTMSEVINGIAIDQQQNVYVTGETQSQDFPTTPGVLQEHSGNRTCLELCTDAFVTKLDASGSSLAYSTYLFGDLDDWGTRIAVDGAGNAIVVGATHSLFFPIRNAFQSSNAGISDAFVTKLNADATRLLFSSYLGGHHVGESSGTGADEATGLAVDPAGDVWIAGYTQSYDFPTTPNAFQHQIGNGICDFFGTPCGDAFVTKITGGGPGVTAAISIVAAPADVAAGGVVSATWAGIPTPTASDNIQLYTLGSTAFNSSEIVAWWPTTGTAGGTLPLLLPADLAPGSYELRLSSPDPEVPALGKLIARSEPIRVGPTAPSTTTSTATPTTTTSSTAHPTTTSTSTTHAPTTSTSSTAHPTTTSTSSTHAPTTTSTSSTTHPTTTTTQPSTSTTTSTSSSTTLPTPTCGTPSACEDGDPCTDDLCIDGHGCVSEPLSGLASVTCTCERPTPATCAGEPLPASITTRREHTCSLVAGAATATDRTLARRRLKRAIKSLKDSIKILPRARREGLSDACAAALEGDARDTKDRAERAMTTATPGSHGGR